MQHAMTPDCKCETCCMLRALWGLPMLTVTERYFINTWIEHSRKNTCSFAIICVVKKMHKKYREAIEAYRR